MKTKNYFFITLLLLCFAMIANAASDENRARRLMDQTKISGFTENKGQIADEGESVLFIYKSSDLDIFITNSGISYVFSYETRLNQPSARESSAILSSGRRATEVHSHRTDMVLKDATINRNNIVKKGKLSKSENIFYNSKHIEGIRNINTWEEVTIREVYPGIDWVLYVDKTSGYAMKYDFLVKPGGNPADIKMVYEGAQVSLGNNNTELNIETSLGTIREGRLLSYQKSKQNSIASSYALNGNEVSFNIRKYNPNEALTIDPPVIIWSTNFGGAKDDYLSNMKVDQNDNLYIYGATRSVTLPGAIGGSTNAGKYDVYVTKFSSPGELLWTVFFGGAGNDDDTEGGITLSNNGDEVYFCGSTSSTDFPILFAEGAYNHNTIEGDNAGFIVKINNEGTMLWSTFICGDGWDYLEDITTDQNDDVYIMGFTSSTDFPIVALEGAFNQPTSKGGMNEGILFKLDENDQLAWSTYFGGSYTDQMFEIKTGPENHLYIVGYTSSQDFPIVEKEGAYNGGAFAAGDWDQAVIMEFNEARSLIWSTYFGGTRFEVARSMTWDSDNNLYVVGETESADMITLEMEGAYFSGNLNNPVAPYLTDAFITRFNANTKALEWSTYFGGSRADLASGIIFDEQGKMWVCGATDSQNFPIVELEGSFNMNSFDPDIRIMYWAMFSETKELNWSTFYGGDDFGWATGFVNRSGSRLLLFTQAETDAGMSSGLIANNPLAYQQGNVSSNDVVIIEFYTDEGVGVTAKPVDNRLTIYPNPANSGYLNIRSSEELSNILIINTLGQIVRDINVSGNNVRVNIDGLNNGLYILTAKTKNGLISKKVRIIR